jgi:hypothetical protein
MRLSIRAVLGVTLAAGLMAMMPAAVFAAQPSCGDTIIADTTLTADLDCSLVADNGINFGANGIVLNLNGHTIWGYTGDDSYTGVSSQAYDKIVVKNGTIANFGYGLYVSGSNRSIFKGLEITGEVADTDDYGVYSYGGVGNVYKHLTIDPVLYGMYMENGASHQVMYSDITADSIGIYTTYETRDTFTGNTVHAYYGFYDDYSNRLAWYSNTANGYEYGWYLNCDGYGKVTLTDNTANGNNTYGFYIYYCYDSNYAAGTGTGTKVTGNTANGNGTGFYDFEAYNAVWKYNVANDNVTDGFYFDYPTNYVVTYNSARRNGNDGFNINDNYSYYNFDDFSYNTSNRNNIGFDAAYGAPGTGNVAKNNTSESCINVDCN